jgi:hypothetical protein
MAAMFDAQYAGAEHRCRTNCVNCLCVAGMTVAEAERSAAFIFDGPEMFRQALYEAKGMAGVEVADPFAA